MSDLPTRVPSRVRLDSVEMWPGPLPPPSGARPGCLSQPVVLVAHDRAGAGCGCRGRARVSHEGEGLHPGGRGEAGRVTLALVACCFQLLLATA
ncbi:hypothetical protein HaLaN_11353 [Haematococcus lacustris]|uniref:Uncharacterized protein n=1 Tax=Haematococcus lacustris TaxID=44745 RepID=A0A699Z8K2_HAELA|nr:hypothetical protein HaLaN_11353 [Haematococcus lacustris]